MYVYILFLPPSANPPFTASPAPSADIIFAPGPPTQQSKKLVSYLDQFLLHSFANTMKYGPIPPRLHAHNSSTQFNPTFSSTKPQPLLHPYPPPRIPMTASPPMIPSAKYAKAHVTKI